MSDPTVNDELVWPPPRSVLRWLEVGEPVQTGYRYAGCAWQAARNLSQRGLAVGVHVVRLADGVRVFDQEAGIELPVSEW